MNFETITLDNIEKVWTLTINRPQAMKTEASEFAELFTTSDFKVGTLAFIEKRKPLFEGN